MLETLYCSRIMYYCKKFVLNVFIITFLFSSIWFAQLDQKLLNDSMIDQRVKNLVDSHSKEWTLMSMTMIENNINKILALLTERYNWQLVVTETPNTEQEKMTYSLWLLSNYLCFNKNKVIEQFDWDVFYSIDINNIISKMGSCSYNNLPTYREAIKYYVLPEIGTLETVHIPLAKKLWYKLEWFESYLNGNLLDMKSDQFFFEEHTSVDIIPLMNLTDSDLWEEREDEFDVMKIIAYVETTNYPFFDDNIMIAVLAKKWDNYIKITTPYQKIRYKPLWNISLLVKELFYRSVQNNINDAVVSNIYFDSYYYNILKDLKLEDSSIQKNKVRQYLTVLRQNDIEPQWYIDFVVQSLKKDNSLKDLLEFHLEKLEPFIDS